jgi:tetratricopeptide (TPR) repeat protein
MVLFLDPEVAVGSIGNPFSYRVGDDWVGIGEQLSPNNLCCYAYRYKADLKAPRRLPKGNRPSGIKILKALDLDEDDDFQVAVVLQKGDPEARKLSEVLQQAKNRGEPEAIALALDALANHLDQKGDGAAEAVYREALAIREKMLGSNHVETAESLNRLGIILARQDDHAGALPLFRRVVKIRQSVLGEHHGDTARALFNLGMLLNAMRDPKRAEKPLREALAAQEKIYPADHPEIATSLTELGTALFLAHQYQEAERCFRRALMINEKIRGLNDSETAHSFRNLAMAMEKESKPAEAEKLYLQALAIWDQLRGPEDPSTKIVREQLEALRSAK